MPLDKSKLTTQLDKAIDHVKKEISALRTGKASVQLLDPVVVEAYGSKLKLQEVANVTVADANLLIVSPWDKNLIADVEKAINISDLNLNPVVDGDKIRIVVPSLTEERRKEMVKVLHQKIESGRVMLRGVRGDFKKELEDQEGEAGVSEDDIKRDLAEMEKVIKQYLETLDEIAQNKEKDLMTI